jgi:hypothetical protein
MNHLPFDPANPFGDIPPAHQSHAPVGIGAEIEQLAAEFAAKGINAHHAVPLWLGKPNRFTSQIMHSAKEVLDYVTAELDEQARARAAAHAPAQGAPAQAPAGGTGDDQGVVSTGATAREAERAALQARRVAHAEAVVMAGEAWRKAIRDRDAAMLEWNKYVEGLRTAFNDLKKNRPR